MLYYKIEDGRKTYTLRPEGATPAVPAKYSPEDSYSHERVTIKKRHGVFPFNE